MQDQSPKFALGGRSIPGKQKLALGTVYEAGIKEVDDFLRNELLADKEQATRPKPRRPTKTPEAEQKTIGRSLSTKKRPRTDQTQTDGVEDRYAAVAALVPSAVKRRKYSRGRPNMGAEAEEDLNTPDLTVGEALGGKHVSHTPNEDLNTRKGRL